jgi:hypothetical protein
MNRYIYVGYDPREQESFDVAECSILRRSDSNTVVIPLKLKELRQLLWRPIEQKDGKMWCPISQAPMSTEFAISRFTIPLLRLGGWAVFMDCDMVCRCDIKELFDLVDDKYAVMVVKHKQEGGAAVKKDNQVQTFYSRKNWSSMMLWNCGHPSNRKLTKEVLNNWPGRDLHAFKWLADHEIGELSPEWNHLVGVNPPIENPKIIHYTLGVPSISGYENCNYAEDWFYEKSLTRTEHIAVANR